MTCKYSDVYMQLTINLDHSSFRDFFLADIMLLLYVTARLGCFSPIGSCGRNELSCPLNSMSCGVVIDFLRLDGYLCPNRIFRRTWPSLGCRCASSLCHPAAAAAASAAPVAPSVAGPSAVRPARSAPAASANKTTNGMRLQCRCGQVCHYTHPAKYIHRLIMQDFTDIYVRAATSKIDTNNWTKSCFNVCNIIYATLSLWIFFLNHPINRRRKKSMMLSVSCSSNSCRTTLIIHNINPPA